MRVAVQWRQEHLTRNKVSQHIVQTGVDWSTGANSTPGGHAGQAGGSSGVQKIVPSVTGLRFLEP